MTCESSTSAASASFLVTVNDVEPPTIDAPVSIVTPATSASGAHVAYPAPVVSDNAPGVTYSCAPPSGAFFPLGVTTVSCVATDAAGNTASASFTVTVRINVQACLYAGTLSQAGPLYGSVDSALSCGRGTAIVVSGGTDYGACLFAGSLTQFSSTTPQCARGLAVSLAAGTDYHGCMYVGTLSRVGTAQQTNCGRGVPIGLARATAP